MSGEATTRSVAGAEALERAFGAEAACSRCGGRVPDYRVIAVFLHDTALVRAYCRGCYPQAVEGEYHARGDGLTLGYPEFARRFGSPGPAPPPATAVDRTLTGLLRDPVLRFLAPPSEALARRRGRPPYRFRVGLELGGGERAAELTVGDDGRILALEGDGNACAHLERARGA